MIPKMESSVFPFIELWVNLNYFLSKKIPKDSKKKFCYLYIFSS